MDDVVQRLRAGLEAGAIDLADIMDAADEIERLRHGTAVLDNCVAGNQPEMPCPVTEPMPKEKPAEASDTEPAAWAVIIPLARGRFAVDDFFVSHSRAVEACDLRNQNTPRGAELVPLYRQPQPTLTDAEREAVKWAADHLDNCGWSSATLRGLLERLGRHRTPAITSGEDKTMTKPKDNAEPSGASGGSQRVAIERLLEMARRGHYYCEDSWYSCPLAEDGCANDCYAKDECSCGASEHNAKVDEIAATLRPLLERLS